MYNQAVILANEETKDKKERKDSTAVALRLKPKSKTIIISHLSPETVSETPKTFEPNRQISPWTFEPQTKDKKEGKDSTAVGLRLQPKSKAIIISHLSPGI